MGRALAISKLESIKQAINTLAQNFKTEGKALTDEAKQMFEKHQPNELDEKPIHELSTRSIEMLSQLPKVNQLENTLEIQEEDAELASIKKSVNADVKQSISSFMEVNKKIKEKLGAMPDAAKIVTEKDYQQEMSFVLKH